MAKNEPHSLKHEHTRHLQNKVLEGIRDGKSCAELSRELGFSDTYIKKLYKGAVKEIIVDNVEDLRKVGVARLDKTMRYLHSLLGNDHPLVSGGSVVHDALLDEDGNPIIDPTTGAPKTKRLKDDGVKLQIIDRLIRVEEQRAKLLGLNMPTKMALTDPTGEHEAQVVQFYIPDNGRDSNGDAAQEATAAN